MDTYTSTPITSSCEEEADIIVVRYEPHAKIQGNTLRFVRPLLKWFGLFSTIGLGALALSPATFNVSMQLRPWIFLTFILWFFAFTAGFFNP